MNEITAAIVRAEMALHNLNQREIARAIGLSDSMVSKLLRGERTATPATIGRIFAVIHRPYLEAAGLLSCGELPDATGH